MIIIEGPDGGGKTTLVKYLRKRFPVLVLPEHARLSDDERNAPEYRSRDAVRKRVYGAILREVTARHRPEIHDRLFFSAMVYDHIFERPTSFNFAEEKSIGRMINALEVPVIFCLPPFEAINKQYLAGQQMSGVPEHIYKIHTQYVQMAGFMGHVKDRKTYKNKQYKVKRMPKYEYNLPPVIIYDFTKKHAVVEVESAVALFLNKRQKRNSTWR